MTIYHQLSALSRLIASVRSVDFTQDPAPSLPAPRIPIAEANGGIRLKDISDPDVPVQVVIAAYSQIQINDSIELFWNNRSVNTTLVDDTHLEQGSITLDVPSIAIQDGTPPVHYRVTSANGTNIYVSHPLMIRVKTNVPGGTDPISSTPHINESLLAVTGVPELVDDANADTIVATVPSYVNMTEGDKLRLSWGGYFIEHTVQASQVGKPLALTVPRDLIEQAGAGPVIIEYEVRDIVNNWSLWSLKFSPDVEVGQGLLRAPDALDVVDGELDLDALGTADARIRVRVYADMAESDVVALSWIARPPTGEPLEHTDQVTIDTESEGLPIEFRVPNAIVQASASGTVAVKYSVNSNRGVQHSKRSSFEVIGQVQRLPAPSVREAVGDELDPGSIPDTGATVTVQAYPGMASGDRVELFLSGRSANGSPSSHNDAKDITGGQVGKPLDFIVPKAFFEPLINGSVDLHYRVRAEESEWLKLNVVGQGSAELQAPTVNSVVDGVLDPDTVPAGTKAVVPQYEGKAIGDRVTLSWAGQPSASFSDFIDVTANNANSPINFDIDHDPYIIGNLNASVAVSYRVTRAGGGSAPSVILPIQVQRQASEEFEAPTVLEAPTGTLDPANATSGATVRVKFDGMQATDTLAVGWTGNNQADTWESDPKPGSVFGQVDFTVPVGVVAASQGKTINVRYVVTRNGQTTVSLELELQVSELAQDQLPIPEVPEADCGGEQCELDLGDFEGDATVTLAPWPLISKGQTYWVVIAGTLENGRPDEFYLASAQPVSDEQISKGLDIPLPRSRLENLKSDDTFSVIVKVAYDQRQSEQQATTLPTRDIRLIETGAGFDDFTTIPRQVFVVNQPVISSTGLVILPVSTACAQGLCSGINLTPQNPLQMTEETTIELTTPTRFSTFTMNYRAVTIPNNSFLEFFDEAGSIGRFPLPVKDGTGGPQTFTTPMGQKIRHVTVEGHKEAESDTGWAIKSFTWS